MPITGIDNIIYQELPLNVILNLQSYMLQEK